MTHTETTVNALAIIVYDYAVEVHEASCRADYDELEHIARQITERLKAKLRAVLEGHQAGAPGAELLVRYCPGCGSVGPVKGKYLDCCPDGNEARMIPEALARRCHDTFRIALDHAFTDQAAFAAQGDMLPREEFAWLVAQKACETEPADEHDPECIRILRLDLKSAVLSAFLQDDLARDQAKAQQASKNHG